MTFWRTSEVIVELSGLLGLVGLGYVVRRAGVLGPGADEQLARFAFWVTTPALLMVTLARSDPFTAFSASLLTIAAGSLFVSAAVAVVAKARRWDSARTLTGMLCASYVNSGNLGIPVAAGLLGDASLVVPVLLFQQILLGPVACAFLDASQHSRRPRALLGLLLAPLGNPIVAGSASGVALAISGWRVPHAALEPLSALGGMSVPLVLVAFGASLRGATPGRHEARGALLLCVVLKVVVHPVVTWGLGVFVFHLTGTALLGAVVLSALPTAQNVFVYALRYGADSELARDSILFSTVLACPALIIVCLLLR
ncbi:AEC family transporter [Streptomyces sp. NPDC057271]|uniref:AEC family transporter n=1 Tax=unclassified Streptomyces TaxID=2593676 RepID=UPI003636648B